MLKPLYALLLACSFWACNKETFELPCQTENLAVQDLRNMLKGRWVCDTQIYDCKKEAVTYNMEFIFPDATTADSVVSNTLIWVYHTQINGQDTVTGYGALSVDGSVVSLETLFQAAITPPIELHTCQDELVWGYNGLTCNNQLGRHFYKVQ